MVILGAILLAQTTDQVKSAFDQAMRRADGGKLHSVLSEKELNGASVKACSSFLALVVKPRLAKIGTYDTSGKMTGVLDPKSPMTIKFRDTGGANMVISDARTYAFEPAIAAGAKKVTTGFADIAFWAAHIEARSKGKTTIERAIASHKLVESWVPKFKAWGIKGSTDNESKKYMTWSQILATSAKEIEGLKKRGQ